MQDTDTTEKVTSAALADATDATDATELERYMESANGKRVMGRIAYEICRELGIGPNCRTSLAFIKELVAKHGGRVFYRKNVCTTGLYFPLSDTIFIAKDLPAKAKATVLLHELTHRLLWRRGQDSPVGYEGPTTGDDNSQWQEVICVAVECFWIMHGGFNFRATIDESFDVFDNQNNLKH